MPDESDLIKLYSTRILKLAADIPHLGQLHAPDARICKRSPLCGSSVTVDVRLDGDRVADFAQDVKACALGQAAAAITGGAIMGRRLYEITAARDALRAMLNSTGPPPKAPFEGFEVLIAARAYKNRHASILLSIEAATEAVETALRATHA